MSTFSKNFKNKNQSQGFIPKLILDNLNSELKNNLEYVYCGDDTYILTSNSDEMKIKIKTGESVTIMGKSTGRAVRALVQEVA